VELGDERIFRQEYPSTPQEAVQATTGLIFPNARSAIIDELPFMPVHVSESERFGGIDFGYHHPTVIYSGVYRSGTLYVTDVYRESERLAVDHREGLIPHTMYFCDPAEVQARVELLRVSEGMACHFSAAPRRRNAGEDISTAEMRILVSWMRDGRVRILRGVASQLMFECDNLAWDEKTGRPDDKNCPPGVGHYDSIYAMKYLVMGLNAIGRPLDAQPKRTSRINRRKELASW
jgi:hypothetical protein